MGAGALPHVLGHDNLRPLLDPLVEDVGPEDVPLARGAIVPRQRERQRRAGVVVPHLVRVELVPDGLARVALEQVVDEGADGAVVHPHGVLERLDEVALFGVGHEPELLDDLLRAVVSLVDRLPFPGQEAGGQDREGRQRCVHVVEEHRGLLYVRSWVAWPFFFFVCLFGFVWYIEKEKKSTSELRHEVFEVGRVRGILCVNR